MPSNNPFPGDCLNHAGVSFLLIGVILLSGCVESYSQLDQQAQDAVDGALSVTILNKSTSSQSNSVPANDSPVVEKPSKTLSRALTRYSSWHAEYYLSYPRSSNLTVAVRVYANKEGNVRIDVIRGKNSFNETRYYLLEDGRHVCERNGGAWQCLASSEELPNIGINATFSIQHDFLDSPLKYDVADAPGMDVAGTMADCYYISRKDGQYGAETICVSKLGIIIYMSSHWRAGDQQMVMGPLSDSIYVYPSDFDLPA